MDFRDDGGGIMQRNGSRVGEGCIKEQGKNKGQTEVGAEGRGEGIGTLRKPPTINGMEMVKYRQHLRLHHLQINDQQRKQLCYVVSDAGFVAMSTMV